MDNGNYELIMLSKVTVIVKPELLTTALIFYNNGTNTFDFRMGPMSLTVLDMAQVFELRPLGKNIDITHDWSLLSLRVGYLCAQKVPMVLGPDFPRCLWGRPILMPFFNFMHCETSFRLHSPADMTFRAAQCSLEVMSRIAHKLVVLNFECGYRAKKEVVYTLVLSKAVVEAARQEAGSSQVAGDTRDISELFEDSEAEAGPEVETQAPWWTKATVVESLESETEERPQPHLARLGLRATPPRKRTRPLATNKHAPTSKEGQDHPTRAFFSSSPSRASFSLSGQAFKVPPFLSHSEFVLKSSLTGTYTLSFQYSPMHEAAKEPSKTFGEPIVLEIPVVSEVTSLRAPLAVSRASQPSSPKTAATIEASGVTGIPIPRSKKTNTTIAHAFSTSGPPSPLPSEAASRGVGVMPLPLAFIPAIASLLDLVREFGQIPIRLRSPRHPSKPQPL
ncbi:S2-RNase [Pyrus ussuriensis x Pyrus communis]|uniref:S2-RNase n=1 Tax=Pyrus ussuriensis x Pyrus communis TaxID=2448454 RepID=A0A5N5GI10_9ROSA|nr:S2-RNase [Pyrus ussuriensis x Pyrus communis]